MVGRQCAAVLWLGHRRRVCCLYLMRLPRAKLWYPNPCLAAHTLGVAQFVEYIIADCNVTRIELSIVWSVVLFICSLLLPFAGRMCDSYGPRSVLAAVAVPYIALLLLMGKVVNLASFIGAFFFMRLIGPGVLVLVGSTTMNHVRQFKCT
jgi:MFS family permease